LQGLRGGDGGCRGDGDAIARLRQGGNVTVPDGDHFAEDGACA